MHIRFNAFELYAAILENLIINYVVLGVLVLLAVLLFVWRERRAKRAEDEDEDSYM